MKFCPTRVFKEGHGGLDPTTAVLAIERLYVLPEDLKLARIPDSQGLGGSSHTEAASDKLSA
jgi:hypothetical protein